MSVCSTCGGRGWHTAGGNDPSPCGRCPAAEAFQSGDPAAYCYLCFNCGKVTDVDEWRFFHYTEDGRRRRPEPDETDPVCECPACHWEHVDDDGSPGIMDGTRADCEREREAATADWEERWIEVGEALVSQAGWDPWQFAENA